MKSSSGNTMKITGLLLTFLGSNALTATIVAKYMYGKIDSAVNAAIVSASNWIAENLDTFIANTLGDAIKDILGNIPLVGAMLGNSVSDSVARVVDEKFSDGISGFVMGLHGISEQLDVGNRAMVNTLFFVALALFISGVLVLVAGCRKESNQVGRA